MGKEGFSWLVKWSHCQIFLKDRKKVKKKVKVMARKKKSESDGNDSGGDTSELLSLVKRAVGQTGKDISHARQLISQIRSFNFRKVTI